MRPRPTALHLRLRVGLLIASLTLAACGSTPPVPTVPPASAPVQTQSATTAAPTSISLEPTPSPPATSSTAAPSDAPPGGTEVPTPAATQPVPSAAPTSSTGTSTDAPALLNDLLPAGYLTAPPNPLELMPAAAGGSAVTQTIGVEGGTLSATGPDGARYVLDIPPNAIAFATAITMTPLSDVGGFPPAAPPEHRIGVELAPSGLQLRAVATLTIQAGDLPEAEVGALSYAGSGHDAGVEPAQHRAGQLALRIEHFSGYVAAWPMKLPEWRAIAAAIQAEKARVFRSHMTTALEFLRGYIVAGGDPNTIFTQRSLAEHQLPEYVRDVLNPAIAAATFGCPEGHTAILTWLEYWRFVQLLGVDPDPNDPNDPNAGFAPEIGGQTYFGEFDFPESLIPTMVEHCFADAYRKCVATGDFPGIFVELFTMERFVKLVGREMEPAWVELMTGYAKRCGQWQVNVTTNLDFELPQGGCCELKSEVRRIIQMRWQPDGQGINGIIAAKIEGSADPTVTSIHWHNDGGACYGDLSYHVTNTKPIVVTPAVVKLVRLDFVDSDKAGNPIPPKPVGLSIAIGPHSPGSMSVEYTATCGSTKVLTFTKAFDEGQLATILFQKGVVSVLRDPDDRFAFEVDKGWQFSGVPFQALTVRSGTIPNGTGQSIFGRIEVLVMHKPQ